ncbi:MAG: hypothetical protein ACTHKH_16965 [Trinickia sp.]
MKLHTRRVQPLLLPPHARECLFLLAQGAICRAGLGGQAALVLGEVTRADAGTREQLPQTVNASRLPFMLGGQPGSDALCALELFDHGARPRAGRLHPVRELGHVRLRSSQL